MKKQSVKDVVFRFCGVDMVGGWDEDDFISWDVDEDATDTKSGADGSATTSYLQNRTWTVKVKYMENSDKHKLMLGFYTAMQAGVQLSGTGFIRRTNSGEQLSSANAVIKRPPGGVIGKSPKAREWTLSFVEATYTAA